MKKNFYLKIQNVSKIYHTPDEFVNVTDDEGTSHELKFFFEKEGKVVKVHNELTRECLLTVISKEGTKYRGYVFEGGDSLDDMQIIAGVIFEEIK